MRTAFHVLLVLACFAMLGTNPGCSNRISLHSPSSRSLGEASNEDILKNMDRIRRRIDSLETRRTYARTITERDALRDDIDELEYELNRWGREYDKRNAQRIAEHEAEAMQAD